MLSVQLRGIKSILDVILGTAKSCFTIPLLSLFPLNICEKKEIVI